MQAAGLSVVMMLLLGLFSGGAPDRRADPAAESKKAYDAVMQQVEPGGDFLLVLNTETFVKGGAEALTELAKAATEGKDDEDSVRLRRVAGELPGFLDRNGFLALQAVGVSSVPEGQGLHRSRAFLLRDVKSADSPLWRGLVGGTPRELASHTYWTEDTVLAFSGTGEAGALWQVVRSVVNELIPEAREEFEAALAAKGDELGVDLEALIASLGGDAFVALMLDEATTFTVPDLDVSLPAPSLLVGLKLKQPLLADRLDKQLKDLEAQMPLVRTTVEGTVLTTIPVPVPAPFPVQPTLAYRAEDGMLLLGSSTDAVRKALETAVGGERRLLASAAFQAEFGGPVGPNNGIFYTGRRFGAALGKVQQAAFAKMQEEDPNAAPLIKRLQAMFGAEDYDVTVVVNTPEGVLLRSRGTMGGGQRFVVAGVVAPLGIMAGLTFPAISSARSSARSSALHAACINNLRMIDSAKEMWALERDIQDGAEPDLAGISEFLKGGALPVCPATKQPYRANPIGMNPECTSGNPQHRLP